MKKYRLIKIEYTLDNSIRYVIEKRVLWWWSRSYLFGDCFGGPSYYSFDESDEGKAKKFLDILNGEKERTTETVIV